MLRAFVATLILAVVTGVSPGAHAALIFSDDFNAYAYELNWNPPANWTSPLPGATDLIGDTTTVTAFDFYPGNGGYVDLDGSNGVPGTLQTILAFAPGTYTVSFDLGGSQRGDADPTTNFTTVTLGDFFVQIARAPTDPLTSYSFTFATTGGQLIFADLASGNNNIGNVLDNVEVNTPVVTPTATVPEPSTVAMIGVLLLALFGMSAIRRSRS